MDTLHIKIIETIITIILYFVFKWTFNKIVDNRASIKFIHITRGKLVKKSLHILLVITLLTFVLIIWGVDQSELAVFIGSVLTVIGIALFAQWSILSNITSGIILFFNHSVRLDDTIIVIDKDFEIEGRISDITLFYVILKTKDNEEITIPNNVFIQKMIKKKY